MSIVFITYATIIIIVELLVLLFFFKNDWKSCVHFAILVNLITYGLSYTLSHFGVQSYFLEAMSILIEMGLIALFWDTTILKALLISLLANGANILVFQLLNWLDIHPINSLFI